MVKAIVATTINGKIALSSSDNISWGSKEDKLHFSKLTKEAGVIIMGKTTFESIGRTLANRKNVILAFDSISELNNKYCKLENPPEFTNEKPKDLIKRLEEKGYQDIFIAGGNSIYTLFLKEKLIEELIVTIEPYIFGLDAIGMCGDIGSDLIKLKIKKVNRLNKNSLVVTYKVNYV